MFPTIKLDELSCSDQFSLLLLTPKEAVPATCNAFWLPKEYHMNKNYIPADISYSRLVVRARHLQGLAICLNRYLFRCLRFNLFCAIAALSLTASDTPAATITVTNGNDSGRGSLRQAIISASSGDTINFAPCLTAVTLTSGELVIGKNLTITGPGAERLTVQRSTHAPGFRIFRITTSTVTVSISGLTISNGGAVNAFTAVDGGGIRNAGVLTLTDCTISGNQALGTQHFGGNGGGVLNEGTMTITRCTISNNSAQYRTGSSSDQATNSGGGILNDSGGSLTITNSTISGNSCTVSDPFGLNGSFGSGGGVSNLGSMTIRNSTISGNSGVGCCATTMLGGGIRNSDNLQITSTTIVDNSASGDSGAVGGGIDDSSRLREQTAVS